MVNGQKTLYFPVVRFFNVSFDISSINFNEFIAFTPIGEALEAVQYLVADTAKVGPLDEVDDIIIANNIAMNANGRRAPNYGFAWSWQDHSSRSIYREKISVRSITV